MLNLRHVDMVPLLYLPTSFFVCQTILSCNKGMHYFMIAVAAIPKGLPQMVDFYTQTTSIVLIYHLGPLNVSD